MHYFKQWPQLVQLLLFSKPMKASKLILVESIQAQLAVIHLQLLTIQLWLLVMDLKIVKIIGLQRTVGEIVGEKMDISELPEAATCVVLLIALLILKFTAKNERVLWWNTLLLK